MRFGADASTINNWERNRTKTVPAEFMPAVIAFLGYNPEPRPASVGGQLRRKRRSLGWTIAKAAAQSSVDPTTWETWEQQDGWPAYPRFKEFVQEFLDLAPDQLVSQIRSVRPASR